LVTKQGQVGDFMDKLTQSCPSCSG